MIPILAAAVLLSAQAGTLTTAEKIGIVTVESDDPIYEVTLPSGYDYTKPREVPPRYFRACGREPWAKVSTQLAPMAGPLPQNPAGITAEEIIALISPPPDAKWTYSRTKWKNLDVGVVEYRAVVADLPVLGLSTILPLKKKALRVTVYAPDPLEKEIREDFHHVISTMSKTDTDWFTDEALRKIATMEKVTIAGVVLTALYPVAWAIFFRGRPLQAHWLRTLWLLAIAVLLFIPVTSPAPTSFMNNLVVNALIPVLFVMLTIRRLKVGIDVD